MMDDGTGKDNLSSNRQIIATPELIPDSLFLQNEKLGKLKNFLINL